MKNLRFQFTIGFLFLSIMAFAVHPEVPVGAPDLNKSGIDYRKLKVSDVERIYNVKMTKLEKFAFKMNKKKYVNYLNAQNEVGTNAWAIAGFVTSFFIGPLGIIFSAIALSKIKKTGEKGRGLAIAGLVIGIVSTVLVLFL